MPAPLIATKLHISSPRRALVARPRLSDRIGRSTDAPLTLVSAPAGFGKSTLLSAWLTGRADRPAAWLSLEPRDSDPVTFWTYLIAALRTVDPALGTEALALLESGQATTDTAVASLLNDLQALATDVTLVLDDYHAIDAPAVHDGMTVFVEHLPPQVHLVIASRADPPLPLARLRARGQLVELRAADLRFTRDEATTYLTDVMGLTLTAPDVAALEERTEGWIAALQLAALSLQGHDDATGFIDSFAGDDRFIVDYLAEEVLQRQPDAVRDFLLRTSILTRLTGPLCDAVTGRSGGKATLEALDRGNLFVVPLDDRREWYRYHHLFADVLRARLLDEQPDVVREVHRRASEWYDATGDRAEAVRHAMAAQDLDTAAGLVERTLMSLRQHRQEATLRAWLEALPDDVVRRRPVLCVAYAGALMVSGETTGVEARLRDAERWLPAGDGTPPEGMVVVDEQAYRTLRPTIAMYRAALALLAGDFAGTKRHAGSALDELPEDDLVGRGGPAALMGLALWNEGQLDAAQERYDEALRCLHGAGHVADACGCAIACGDILKARGRLREAEQLYTRMLRAATEPRTPVRGAADMHVALAHVLRERGDLDAARRHLAAAAELGEAGALPQNAYRSRVCLALVLRAEGDLDGALPLLDEAQLVYTGDYSPDVRPVAATRARLLVAAGRVDEAVAWARDRGLSTDDELSYVREYEHVTLARIVLATGRAREAGAFLDRLLRAAEEGGRARSVVEILVLQTLARAAAGDGVAATRTLERAVLLAEPEGYVRLLADEGAPLATLLRGSQTAGAYAHRLLAAMRAPDVVIPTQAGLVEPLSAREIDVLRLLASDLNGPDIARHLVVSLNTVRTHTKNIYAKLGVSSRREAVTRAADLGLLTRR